MFPASSSLLSTVPYRGKALIELLIALSLVYGTIWVVYPLFNLPLLVITVLIFALLFLYAAHRRGETCKAIGFRFDNFSEAIKWNLVFIFVSIFILSALWPLYFPVNLAFYKEPRFWQRLLLGYPVWALVQQAIVLGFFFRRFREIFSPYHPLAIVASALFFASIHVPNIPLTIVCFVGGLVWAAIYHFRPNLFAIALSHAALGVFCSYVLLMYPVTGPFSDQGRISKTESLIHYAIDSVDGRTIYSGGKLVINKKELDRLEISGWAVGANDPLKQVFLCVNDKQIAPSKKIERGDVADHFQNPAYRHSGFKFIVPTENLTLGRNVFFLRVVLENSNSIFTRKIWFRIVDT
jgi:membrane protease YdiL (CAAX protease family)